MKKIHVMQVLHTLEIGGAEKLAYDISKNFDPDFKFSFFCLDGLGYLSGAIRKKGGNTYCFGRKDGLDFSLIKNFAKLLTDKKVDIVHAHQYTPYFYSVLASFFSKRKPAVIFTEHGRHQPDKVRPKRVVFNKILQFFTNKYTGVAKFSKDSLVQFEKISKKRIEVIYNGIDLEKFPEKFSKSEIRKKLGFNLNDKLIGIIARLDPIKDHKSLIEAVSIIKDKFSNCKLLIVGDGPMREHLEKQTEKLNLKKNIVFLGMRTDVPDILMALDIFVLPSIMEAASVTLLEAMSASLPVIASNAGGNKEIVVDGVTGILVEPQNPDQIAGALERLFTDKTSAENMGLAGRQRVEQNFTFDKMIEQYKNLYLESLKK
ncbi:glycosyltransferase [bacterium]|nr:glycosyltransferase [bacterium]